MGPLSQYDSLSSSSIFFIYLGIGFRKILLYSNAKRRVDGRFGSSFEHFVGTVENALRKRYFPTRRREGKPSSG